MVDTIKKPKKKRVSVNKIVMEWMRAKGCEAVKRRWN